MRPLPSAQHEIGGRAGLRADLVRHGRSRGRGGPRPVAAGEKSAASLRGGWGSCSDLSLRPKRSPKNLSVSLAEVPPVGRALRKVHARAALYHQEPVHVGAGEPQQALFWRQAARWSRHRSEGIPEPRDQGVFGAIAAIRRSALGLRGRHEARIVGQARIDRPVDKLPLPRLHVPKGASGVRRA